MLDLESGPDSAPCPECPRALLDDYLYRTAGGQWIMAIFDLDFALRNGFRVTLDEVSYREFQLLKIVIGERANYEREQQEAEIAKSKRSHGR